jgi:hypothetical protein
MTSKDGASGVREWWIEPNVRDTCLAEVLSFEPLMTKGAIHVIEYSYVEKLEAQLKTEREATARIINDLKERLACYRRLDEAAKNE